MSEEPFCPMCYTVMEFKGTPPQKARDLYECPKCGFIGARSLYSDDMENEQFFLFAEYEPDAVYNEVVRHWKEITETLKKAKKQEILPIVHRVTQEIEIVGPDSVKMLTYGGLGCAYCRIFSYNNCHYCPYKVITGWDCSDVLSVYADFAKSKNYYWNEQINNKRDEMKKHLDGMIEGAEAILQWNIDNREEIISELQRGRKPELRDDIEEAKE